MQIRSVILLWSFFFSQKERNVRRLSAEEKLMMYIELHNFFFEYIQLCRVPRQTFSVWGSWYFNDAYYTDPVYTGCYYSIRFSLPNIAWYPGWVLSSNTFVSVIRQKIFLCLWFRTSLIYINDCPTRCNTKQSIYYSASSLYMFRVSNTPIIRSTQICNYSLWYWSYFLCATTSLQRGVPAWLRWREVVAHKKYDQY